MDSFDIGIISANIGFNSIYRDPAAEWVTDKELHSTASINKCYANINEQLTGTSPLQYRRFSDTLNQLEDRRVVESRRVFAGRSGAHKEYAIRLEYVGDELLGSKYWDKMMEAKAHLKELLANDRYS